MKLPHFSLSTLVRDASISRLAMAAALVSLPVQAAFGATIQGLATDTVGNGLYKVQVCLAFEETPTQCEKTRWTDKNGRYSFPGLQEGGDYIISINGDKSVAASKQSLYRTYVWEPARQTATVESKKDSIDLYDFAGKFGFSNFQRTLTLTAADFPELASVDFLSSHVFLKVFIPAEQVDAQPKTISLGEVRSLDKLSIEASVPLAVGELAYEIFTDSGIALNGSIVLTQN